MKQQEHKERPIAIVILEDDQWVVQNCPYCGKRHYHGAGGEGTRQDNLLGHRSAHCTDDNIKGIDTSRGYMLERSVV